MPRKKYIDFDCQASRVIAKFGGTRRLAEAITRYRRQTDPNCPPTSPESLYKWRMPKQLGGTDGLVPTCTINKVIGAARLEGILLTAEDFMPTLPPDFIPALPPIVKVKENK